MPKTSVYLTDDLAAAVRASGEPMAELIRRGLGIDAADARQIAAAAALHVAGDISEELRGMRAEIRELRDAVRGASGGNW